jgi:glyoxylase-like metal-dependent hydrolase (beta-lactamase superfamily II)
VAREVEVLPLHAPVAPRPDEGERWLGFARVRPIDRLAPEVLMIPLVGHTRGHAGVAVAVEGGWLLHCGDAYFFHGELEPVRRCPPGLKLVQRMDDVSRRDREENQARLRRLAVEHPEVKPFCAHDPVELARFA